MKTKLLKKIRKRYSITRIDNVTYKSNDLIYELSLQYNTPFFIVEDDENEYNFNGCQTFEEARNYLYNMIRNQYVHDFKDNRIKKEKVWWIKK
jgi:hypothetical protein